MENFDTCFLILHHNVVIRKIGSRYILIRTDYDYSKRNMISLTVDGVRLLDFIKLQRSILEVFKQFDIRLDEQKSYLDYFNFLSKEGYITLWDMQMEGKEFISAIARKEWAPNHTPANASIELTPRCNFNCIHCYLDNDRAGKNELETAKIKTMIDILADAGMLVLTLTGGEPLIRADFKEIYLYARKKGLLVELFTNGFLLNSELLEVFKEFPPLELDISLYGSTDAKYEEVTGIKGAFTRIKDNIKLFKENGINISLKSAIMSNLENDLDGMFAVAKELGINMRIRFCMIPTVNNVSKANLQIDAKKAVELYASYSNTYKNDVEIFCKSIADPSLHLGKTRYACGMGKCSCFIDYRGIIYPCIETRPLGIGVSIFDEKFEDIWRKIGEYSYEGLNELDEKEYKCLKCKSVGICPSCPAIRERKYGSPLVVKDEDCEYTNALSDYIMKSITPTQVAQLESTVADVV
jgi:radical SAM protein with 4Fe4S-binding SPASM domain